MNRMGNVSRRAGFFLYGAYGNQGKSQAGFVDYRR